MALAVLLAGWAWYALVQKTLGPLNHDEAYFAHAIWMIGQGLRPFVDFPLNHLPFYFQLVDFLHRSDASHPLQFVFALRVWGVIFALILIVMAIRLDRANRLVLAIGAISFIVFTRITEIRADTLGLLIMNIAWFLLLTRHSKTSLRAATAMAPLALLFSARAAAFSPVFAAACLFLAWRRKDKGFVWFCVALGAAYGALALIYYFADPARATLMIERTFTQNAVTLSSPDLIERFAGVGRFYPVILVVLGAIIAWQVGRKVPAARDQAGVIMIACAGQLALIVLDPAPYEYVYGWAMIPALAGLALGLRHSLWPRVSMAALLLVPAAMLAMAAAYLIGKGQAPPARSNLRITVDAPSKIDPAMRLEQLVAIDRSDMGLHSISNDMRLKEAICTQIDGTVLADRHSSPLCVLDPWASGIARNWPPLQRAGDDAAYFAAMFARQPPDVLLWSPQEDTAMASQWAQGYLSCRDVHEGVAVLRPGGCGIETSNDGGGTRERGGHGR